jgi:hypothetical protein
MIFLLYKWSFNEPLVAIDSWLCINLTSLQYACWKLETWRRRGVGEGKLYGKGDSILLHIFEEDKTHVSQAWFALGCQLFFFVLQIFGNTFNHKKGT